MLAVPVPWRKWMILSKPIRQPVEGSTDSRGVDRRCGGNAPRDHPSEVRLKRVWLALAVIRMGWLSAVGKVQHLHRRMVKTGVLSCCGLDPSSELLRGKPFLMQKPPLPSLWSNVYMDSFGIRKNVRGTKVRKLVGKPSMSKILHKKILGKCEIPQTEEESVMSSAKAITMGSFGDRLQELVVPGLARLLEHVALAALVVIPGRVPLEWFQATFERLVFVFQHKLPCFGALSSI